MGKRALLPRHAGGGQAVAFASLGVLVWLGLFAVAVVSFVTAYEQPTLRRAYGASYDAYCRAVPAWWPRRTPWNGPDAFGPPPASC